MFCIVCNVYSYINTKSQEICIALYSRQFILHIQVRVCYFSVNMFKIYLLIFSFSFLWGPLTYLKYMFSRERICLTLLYGATLISTLYCALHLQNTPLTILCAVGQVVTLLWTIVSGVPGGSTGIKFFSKIFSRTVTTTLPV